MEDHELISHYLSGDAAAFDSLVQKYMSQVYRFVYSYVQDGAVAEDITQETFVKVWRNLKKADRSKQVKSWIYTIAKNTALDYLKKKKAVPFSRFETENGGNALTDSLAAHERFSPEQVAELGISGAALAKAIGTLSKDYRTIFSMYYYEYLNFREIAEALKVPINTIKSRHRRGLAILRTQITE